MAKTSAFSKKRIVIFLTLLVITANVALIFLRAALKPGDDALIGNSGIDMDAGIESYEDYLPIDANSLPQRLRSISIANKDVVSTSQIDRLIDELTKNLYAYKIGNAAAILKDRLSADYSIRPEATKWHKEVLTKHLLKPGEQLPSDPEEVMRLFVDRQYGGTNGSGYANLYNDLSVEGSSIEFRQCKELPQSIEDRCWELYNDRKNTFRGGVITPLPSIEYRNSPKSILAQSGSLTIADVKLAASNSDKQKYSRFKRFYWSKDDTQWLPMEVVLLYAKKRKADEFF